MKTYLVLFVVILLAVTLSCQREFSQLTEEQKTTLHEKIKSMHEDGATREEIHTEIVKMLEEYGIDVPVDFVQRNTMWNKLNDEQRNAIRAKKREMRKEGASREEIKKEIEKMIQAFGINESEDQTETGVETAGESLSIRSFPNPFNPETTIEYQLNTSAQVSINIYDIQGQLVKSLGQGYRQAGTYNTKWNGLTESGYQVPSGIYFIRITAGSETLNHRIVMMK